jgi:HSP20 family protein
MTGRRRDIGRMHEEISELFDDLWRVPRFSGLRRGFRPPVDCFRTENPPELTVVVELAGVAPESIELVALDGELVVSGERRRPPVERPLSYYQMEIEYGPFQRRVSLPDDVDTSAARAEYRDGLLTVAVPIRRAAPKQQRVSIPLREAR